ncbi:helix-turn-helix domain-containing protein [Streptomyces sp. NPDC046203]|uniref:MmyB family transcriptional regulator n=1 Tax=Streptomyces sp. NPDC046203 TaxID=3154602 RepID=UPI0033ED6B81
MTVTTAAPDTALDALAVPSAATPAATPGPVAAAATEPETRRHELAAFLRSRRERITPEQVGLPRGRRRRTPGLRREEVAQLSAVGVTWYTWLEQARPIQVSPQVLDALAGALLLDLTERTHLFALAGQADPHPGTARALVTPALRQLLDQLEPIPACVQNSRYDLLAYNRTFATLYCDLDTLPVEDRNTLWLAFTHEGFRAAVIDLPDVLRALAGKFRASMAEHLAEPAWKAQLRRLQNASAEFREIWDRHDVADQAGRVKVVRNARVGMLRLEHTNLWVGPAAGTRLVTYTPLDPESRAGLERLRERVLEEEAEAEAAEAERVAEAEARVAASAGAAVVAA